MLRTCLYFQLQTKRQELYSVLIIKLRTFVRIAETLQVLWDASNHLNKSVFIDYGIGLYVTRIVLYFEGSESLHGSINWKNQLRVVFRVQTILELTAIKRFGIGIGYSRNSASVLDDDRPTARSNGFVCTAHIFSACTHDLSYLNQRDGCV